MIHGGVHAQLHAFRAGGLGLLAQVHGPQTGGRTVGTGGVRDGRGLRLRPGGKGVQHGRVIGHQHQMPFQQVGGEAGAGQRPGSGHGRHIVQQLFRDHGLGREMLQSL